jgi:hypothetical protein
MSGSGIQKILICLAVLLPFRIQAQELQPAGELCQSALLASELDTANIPQSLSVAPSTPLPLTPAEFRAVDVVVVSSGDFTAGRSDAEVVQDINEALELANRYYLPVGLVLRLSGVQIFQQGLGDPYAEPAARHDARQMLETLRGEWSFRESPQHAVTVVFGKSSFGSTYGLAYPGTTCLMPQFAMAFASQSGDGTDARLNFGATLAHEIGHTFGLDHDSNVYADGPSLMWPYFSPNISGFSQYSLNQFADFQKRGGLDCLPLIDFNANTVNSTGGLQFQGGAVQHAEVAEGSRLHRVFSVGDNFPGVSYTAEGLPAEARFDRGTGVLDYTPSYDTTDSHSRTRTFDVRITASTFRDKSELSFTLVVQDVNRPPVYTDASGTDLSVEAGSVLDFPVLAVDPDPTDRARLKLVNNKTVSSYPGKPKSAKAAQGLNIHWNIPLDVRGSYPFVFSASDSRTQVSRTVNVLVRPRNEAPRLEVPATVSADAGSGTDFRISAVDPEGQPLAVDLKGFQAGTLIESDHGAIHVQFAPGETAENFNISVSATDGEKSAQSDIPVAVRQAAKDGAQNGIIWPGKAAAFRVRNDFDGDGLSEQVQYRATTGEWTEESCNHSSVSATFGTEVGDFPLVVRRHGKSYRGIYRVVKGQGWWLIDLPGGIESTPWGLSRDIPVAGDFDGDGVDDFAVYRPDSRQWFIKTPEGEKVLAIAPSAGDALVYPLAADIDGDGRDEPIVFYRTADGEVRYSSLSESGKELIFVVAKVTLEQAVVPLAADVDGDGRVDFGAAVPGAAVSLFLSSSGKMQRYSTVLPSAALLSYQHCGNGGEQISSLDMADTLTPLTTPEAALLSRSYQFGHRTEGDVDGDQKANLVVWRRDRQAEAASWITQSAAGGNTFFAALPAQFSYQLSGSFFDRASSVLTNFGDGLWASQRVDGSIALERWGQFGDVPVAGDYNGDGLTDYAIYRSADSSWWILYKGRSGEADRAKAQYWGERGDIPVPADYDGDGATDIAVYRPSTGGWYVIFADGRVRVTALGNATDIPVPGDYFGQGHAEIAVWRPQSGSWYIKRGQSKDEVVQENWGLSQDSPVPGDYDGDGREDLAVWRPAEGNWYLHSLGGATPDRVMQFGLPNDEPLNSKRTLRIF